MLNDIARIMPNGRSVPTRDQAALAPRERYSHLPTALNSLLNRNSKGSGALNSTSRNPITAITIIFSTLSPLDSYTSPFGPHPSVKLLPYLETEEIGARSTESRFH